MFIVYCLLFFKIVRNEYEYQDKFLICVNVFGNKPFLIMIMIIADVLFTVKSLSNRFLNKQTNTKQKRRHTVSKQKGSNWFPPSFTIALLFLSSSTSMTAKDKIILCVV